MKSWREVWRKGFARVLPLDGLKSLRDALANNDRRLKQGTTTEPSPLICPQDWPCEGACALGWTKYKGGGSTVGEVEEHFAKACFDADQLLGEPAACRWFLNWFDDTPREDMRRELVAEVESAIAARVQHATGATS